MNQPNPTYGDLKPSHIEKDGKPMIVAGISRPLVSSLNIPGQWEQFNVQRSEITDQIGLASYGICLNMGNENQSEYMCGVEVSNIGQLPGKFSYKELPPCNYTVFVHAGHVSTIRQTIDAANKWVAQSKYELDGEPAFFFERYKQAYNPETGTGAIEIWIPIK